MPEAQLPARYYVREGTWPFVIAGDNRTFYVMDSLNLLEDSENPEYFSTEAAAKQRATVLNQVQLQWEYHSA